MKRYAVYDAADFDLYGSPSEGEAYVIIAELDKEDRLTGAAELTYIYTDDIDVPPKVDMDAGESLRFDIASLAFVEPAFDRVLVADDGLILLPEQGKEIVLDEKQNDVLGRPFCIRTESARYDTNDNMGGPVTFTLDRTLEGLKTEKVDMQEFRHALNDKYPALLVPSHDIYGNRYPYFPNGKYFEDKEKMVVFMTKDQLFDLSEEVKAGECPFYYDYYMDRGWDVNNTYGICIIETDKHPYGIKLVSPKSLDRVIERYRAESPSAER